MYAYRRRTRIEIWTPAKLNLHLEVMARRPDGYHEIETLMVPIALFDHLCISDAPLGQTKLDCRWARGYTSGTEAGVLPETQQNLVYRAVQLVRERFGVREGIRLDVTKRIPAASGLGGGSSDAAAAILGAAWWWGLAPTPQELRDLGAALGSDIPFFFHGGAAVCRGRGELIEPIPSAGRLHFVVVRPADGLSTADIYRQTQVDSRPHRIDEMLTGFRRGDATTISRSLFNRLQESAGKCCERIQQLEEQFDELNLLGHQMSGSGSAYFGVCRNAGQARRVEASLRSRSTELVFRVASVGGRDLAAHRASQN